jgi:hypothetical protein
MICWYELNILVVLDEIFMYLRLYPRSMTILTKDAPLTLRVWHIFATNGRHFVTNTDRQTDKSVTAVLKLRKAEFLARRLLSWVHTLSCKSRSDQEFFKSGCSSRSFQPLGLLVNSVSWFVGYSFPHTVESDNHKVRISKHCMQ